MTETAHEPRLISIRDVCALTSLSRTFVNQLRSRGLFPEPVALGEKRIAFVKSEIISWLEQRIASRSQGQR